MRRVILVAAAALCACQTTSTAGDALSPRDRALTYLARGDAKQAVPLVEALAAKRPQDLELARLLAEAHVRNGSGDLLLKRLEGKDDAVSHYARGLVLFARAADASGPAIAEFRRAAELAPDQAELHYRLGLALLESEKLEEALVALRKATAMAPDKSGWALPLAKALARTGDGKAAVQAIRTLVTGDPTPAEVKTARALMDQIADPFAGFPRAARPQLEQAIQWLEVADVPQQAIVQLEEILRDYPDLAVVHALLGLAYARIEEAGRALDELNRAIELAPEDGKNHLYLADLYLSRQRPKVAQQHLEQAIEHNPVLGDAWFKLGDLALEREDLAGAKAAFFTASRLDPDAVAPRGKLALVYQLQGDWPAADRELRRVNEKDPDNVEIWLRLGVLHTERYGKAKAAGEKKAAADEAAKWLEKVLEAQPENALASKALERVKAQ